MLVRRYRLRITSIKARSEAGINARLPAEAGQMFIKAIEAACEEIPAEAVSAATPNVKWQIHSPARKVDVVAIVAEMFLAQGRTALKGGERKAASRLASAGRNP